MSIWAVGDIQGRFDALQALLERIAFDPAQDRLWLVGDLVNRGGEDVAVLRWARDHDAVITAVLGNHDLHLLARWHGVAEAEPGDTVDAVLEAPDAAALVGWLAGRPLLHRQGAHLLVHAGLLPAWTPDAAQAKAREVETALAGPRRATLLDRRGGHPLRSHLDAFVSLRFVDADGEPAPGYKGAPDGAPDGRVPWFDAPGRRATEVTVVCGHWAALGLLVRDDLLALDTGCVWGGALTAVRLEDRAVVQVPCERDDGLES